MTFALFFLAMGFGVANWELPLEKMDAYFSESPDPPEQRVLRVLSELDRRFVMYEQQMEKHSMEDGMIIVRGLDGSTEHICDSLLFSSLHFVALKRMNYYVQSAKAFKGLRNSFIDGRWRRHPLCANRATSRDMLLGLLVTLSQSPEGGKAILKDLLKTIEEEKGFFDRGPVYVSYATPQILEFLRLLAAKYGVDLVDLGFIENFSFGTLDLNSRIVGDGYQSHLIALSLWLDMELRASTAKEEPRDGGWLVTATTLYRLDRSNLFFKFLYLSAKNAPSHEFDRLAQELIDLPQFPKGFLPMDCDRRSDYLWQRASREWKRKSSSCEIVFPAVDFQFLTAILRGKMSPPATPSGNPLAH